MSYDIKSDSLKFTPGVIRVCEELGPHIQLIPHGQIRNMVINHCRLQGEPFRDTRDDRDTNRNNVARCSGLVISWQKCPFLEDVHQVGDAEVAILGAPLDAGTTYRPGTRFGPSRAELMIF